MPVDTVKHNNIDIMKLVNDCLKVLRESEDRMGHVNIIIAGKTGVGKSTLINAAFRFKKADTGMGMPVTQETQLIEEPGMPLRIYDSVGLELTEETKQKTIDDIKSLIEEKKLKNNPDEIIHCMWYCVQANSDRLEKPEQNFIAEIAEQIPVILVITKAFRRNHAKELAGIFRSYRLAVRNICIVLAQDCDDEDYKVKAYGIEELLKITLNILSTSFSESACDAFINAQTTLELKNQKAVEIVNQTVAMAFGEGFLPIPVADIFMLIPTEITMMARITNVYGLEMTQDKIKRILFIMFSSVGAASASVFFAKSLIKIIPGIGTIAGGLLNGAAAGLMTQTFGRTYIFIMNKLYTGEMSEKDFETPEGREQIKKIMRGEMQRNESIKEVTDDKSDEKKIDEDFKNISRDMIDGNKPRKGIFARISGLFGKK